MTKSLAYKILNNGDSAISLVFEAPISEQLNIKIIQLCNCIRENLKQEVQEVIPAYQSLTVIYDSLLITTKKLNQTISQIANSPLPKLTVKAKLIKIPVCYESEFSPDIDRLSNYSGLSKQQIIQRHTAPTYRVQMLGFLPGFLYLGGLDESLQCPRKTTPEIKIPKGSVGIGGNQTGIYPISSPGGWQLIGRTPLNLFQPEKAHPFIASPLDKIQFFSINKTEFLEMEENLCR